MNILVKDAAKEKLPLYSVAPENSLAGAYKVMRAQNIHHLLVIENEKLIGLVSDRDLFENAMSEDGFTWASDKTVAEVMPKDLPFLSETSTLSDAMTLMEKNDVSGLPLVIEGKAQGIMTHSDILGYLTKILNAQPQDFGKLEGEAKSLAGHPLGMRLMELLNDIGL